MNPRKIIPAVMAATLAVGALAAPVLAAERSQRGENRNDREIAAVRAAAVTPAAAIAAAEQATGGRAIAVAMEDENGAPLYEVRVVAGERMLTLKIDPANGAIRTTERDGLIARLLGREDSAELAAMLRAPTTLTQAIAAAEQAGGGRAVEASWEDEDGAPAAWEVKVAREGGGMAKVMVDAATGQARLPPAR